jgi:hypothetical protein
MEATCSSETSLDIQLATRYYIPVEPLTITGARTSNPECIRDVHDDDTG